MESLDAFRSESLDDFDSESVDAFDWNGWMTCPGIRTNPTSWFWTYPMPDVNGFDLCRQIKRITPETRIVFLTAFDDEDLRHQAFSVGAVALVTKHSVDQLLVAIHGA